MKDLILRELSRTLDDDTVGFLSITFTNDKDLGRVVPTFTEISGLVNNHYANEIHEKISELAKTILKLYAEDAIVNPCNCGTANKAPHEVTEDGCTRVICDAPIPSEKPYYWIVDGIEITDTTLRQQRGYGQHKGGVWSRFSEGSTNSLPDET